MNTVHIITTQEKNILYSLISEGLNDVIDVI